MEPSDLIFFSNREANTKFSETSHLISNLIWESTSSKINNETRYDFQDSVGHSVNNSIWHVVKNSSKILISNLNEKHSYSQMVSNE
jgi:hypothetical protein